MTVLIGTCAAACPLAACSSDGGDASSSAGTGGASSGSGGAASGGKGGTGGNAGTGGIGTIGSSGSSGSSSSAGEGGASEPDAGGTAGSGNEAGEAGTGSADAGAGGEGEGFSAAGSSGVAWEPRSALIIPPETPISGESQSALAAEWWQWAYSIPASTNPALDTTGARCGEAQPPGVFFLAGTFGGAAERTCNVPAGTPLFFPLYNLEGDNCNTFPGGEIPISDSDADPTNDFTSIIKSLLDGVTGAELDIGGHVVISDQDLAHYRTSALEFSFFMPDQDSMFDRNYPPPDFPDFTGICRPAVEAGFYVGLRGLGAGQSLEIHFRGAHDTDIEATYHLTAQ